MGGEGTLFQKKSNMKWYWIYSLGEKDHNGHYIRKWYDLETTDKNQAKKNRDKIKADIVKKGRYDLPSKESYNEWLDFWLEEIKKPTLKPTAYDDYECQIRVHIKPKLGQYQLKKITPEILQRFYNEKRLETKLGFEQDNKGNRLPSDKPLSARTIQKIQMIIRASLQKAVIMRKIPENPDIFLDRIEYKSPPAKFLTSEEILDFLGKAKSDHHLSFISYSAIITSLGSGLREGEICALKWDDIDFKKWTIRVNEALSQVRTHEIEGKKQKVITQIPKSVKSKRIIPVPLDVIVQLRLLRWYEKKKGIISDYLFCHPTGHPYSPKKLCDLFVHLADRVGYPEITFHKLRHSYASMLLEKGEDSRTIQENLGHATNRVTEIYAHVIEKMQKRAADRIEGFSRQRKTVDK